MMVKVGGGWETLEDYLQRHVPNRSTIQAYNRPLHSNPSEVKDMFLGMSSRYKSTNQSRLFYYSLC